MSETITVKISKSVGYSGKNSLKSYIAKIGGTDKQYIFSREFVNTEPVDKNDLFNARRKRKGSWVEAAALDAGLYEVCRCGEKEYIVVWVVADCAKWGSISGKRATAMAVMMDDGKTSSEARIATRAAPAKMADLANAQDAPPAL